jgi:Domain of unknown function (DUF6438)
MRGNKMLIKLKIEKCVSAFLFFSTLFFTGLCKNVKAQSKSEIIITIERTACLGSCPIYYAEIYLDGTVVYKGEKFVKVEGEKQYKIPQVRIKMLIEEFQKINYFSLNDKYETDKNGMSITDQPTTITSIKLNGKQKKVVNYYGAPKELEKLENKIDDFADLLDYVGPI